MTTISRMLHCDSCTDRLTYQRNIALLAAGKAALDLVTMSIVPELDPGIIVQAWSNPFVLVQPWLAGTMPFIVCISTFAFYSGLAWNSVHRVRHAGHKHWFGLLVALPFAGLPIALVCALLPPAKRSVWDIVG